MTRFTQSDIPAKLLRDRYEIQQQLGKNAGRITLLARDLQTQDLVVVKLVLFNQEFEWDDLKLFEREAQAIQSLSHPAIPRYVDHFELSTADHRGFALVQSYIPAQSLANHVQAGRTFSEAEIQKLAEDILEILCYLHSRQPPVIHRDLKPSNILLGENAGQGWGSVYLVDFGSVQTLVAKPGGTITVVGTYGYMPPEQFGGRAVPASDLYSLGATLIYLATGTHPADLPQEDGRLQFESLTSLSAHLKVWLRKLIEPSLGRRFTSAAQALQMLEQPQQLEPSPVVVTQPTGSKIGLSREGDRLEIRIPPPGLGSSEIPMIPFGIAWNSFIAFWTFSALQAPFPINLVFSLFSLPFWTVGLGMTLRILMALFQTTYLQITPQQIRLVHQMLGFEQHRLPASPRQAIDRLELVRPYWAQKARSDRPIPPTKLVVWAGIRKYELGDSHIAAVELEWLAHELSEYLGLPISYA